MGEAPRKLELRRRGAGAPSEVIALEVHSAKDPLALLVEAAEDLCLEPGKDGVQRIAASDVKPFVIPRLRELLDPENEELRFVLREGSGEKISEHAIQRAIARGVWPTSGSVALEAAVLCVRLAALALRAAESGEGVEIDWGPRGEAP